MKEESWVKRWTHCSRCNKITPHEPYFQNWGHASPKCMECGNVNLFRDYHDVDCELIKLISN